MDDDDHNSMSVILACTRRSLAPEPSRVLILTGKRISGTEIIRARTTGLANPIEMSAAGCSSWNC
jgi:hypothetical protein